MYILLVGFPPFSSRTNNQEELFDQILSGMFEFNSPDWDDITYSAKELISWMLQVCIILKSIGLNTYFSFGIWCFHVKTKAAFPTGIVYKYW